ncbi:MAG TPA: hypothetical protein VE959_09625 [Bryobacteraceae bacterium]|nr:hypothetical protein [Bryobacteraceae bacterium]
MRRLLLLVAGLAVRAAAQPDPSELLPRVRDRVLHTVDRLPRYMCTQTVDRSQYEPDRSVYVKDCEDLELSRDTRWKLVRTAADRVRLDVGVASGREIYSWVGENWFLNRSLFDIVTEGSMSTGYFQGFLEVVFRSDNADFSYAGETTDGGRKLMEYHYRVPRDASHYIFRGSGQVVTTAYEGTVLADPETADLVRLTVLTSHLPTVTGTCEATTTMYYSRLRLNDSDFLLPSETRLQIKDLNGVEKDNRTVYSGCHEFLGESTLKFEEPPDRPAQKAAAPRAETAGGIPARLPFSLALAEDIHVATAAAGETVKAVLTTDVRDQSKKVLVANRTPVVCRILRILRYYQGRDSRAVGRLAPLQSVDLLLRLEDFRLPAGNRPVFARLGTAVPDASRRRPGTLQSRPVDLGPLKAMGQNQWFARFERAGDDYVIKSGLASHWVTVAPPPGANRGASESR